MKVHVYPVSESFLHNTFGGGADCICEPDILDLGADTDGSPARVFKHRIISMSVIDLRMVERRVA